MRLRNDFVSNSSSSSFLCEICNNAYAGYDGEYEDTEGRRKCVNEHSMCAECVVKYLVESESEKEAVEQFEKDELLAMSPKKLKEVAKNYPNIDVEDENKSVKDLIEEILEAQEEACDDCDYDEIPESKCPLCSRTTLSDTEGLAFLKKKYNLVDKDILKEMQKQYPDYKKFKKEVLKK